MAAPLSFDYSGIYHENKSDIGITISTRVRRNKTTIIIIANSSDDQRKKQLLINLEEIIEKTIPDGIIFNREFATEGSYKATIATLFFREKPPSNTSKLIPLTQTNFTKIIDSFSRDFLSYLS